MPQLGRNRSECATRQGYNQARGQAVMLEQASQLGPPEYVQGLDVWGRDEGRWSERMTEIATTHGGCRYYMALYRSGAKYPYKRTCTLTGYSCLYDHPQFTCERKRFAELSQGWTTFDPHDTQRSYDALFGP